MNIGDMDDASPHRATSTPSRDGCELVGHRGAPRLAPENTLPAFAAALRLGADALELDVHVTADGAVVVHHDALLHGGDLDGAPIIDLPLLAVRAHEVAPGIPVPTLDEVLGLARDRAVVYVELKGRGAERPACDVIRASATRCAVHSFDHEMVRRAARIAPEIPRGILFEDSAGDVIAAMAAASARDLWPHWSLVTEAMIADVHARGGRVIAWTVNDADVARRLVAWDVDGLCSDDITPLGSVARSG